MIVSFRDKRTREFAEGKFVKSFSGFSRQAEMKLDQLEAATAVRDLAVLPGNRLESLKGDRLQCGQGKIAMELLEPLAHRNPLRRRRGIQSRQTLTQEAAVLEGCEG